MGSCFRNFSSRGPRDSTHGAAAPGAASLTIAFLADIPRCKPWRTAERIESIVETTTGLGADLIVLLGDYAASHRYVYDAVHSDDWSAAVAGFKAPLGVHAIV